MLVAAIVLGMLVSLQWSAHANRRPLAPDQVSHTIYQLELEQSELKGQVSRLREAVNAQQQQAAASTELLEGLRSELVTQKVRAGLIDVQGPGVRVVLDDSRRPPAGNPDLFLVHDYDLRDAINVLWLAGAEAISVNGERIVSSTSVYCVGSTVLVNDTRLSAPYEVSATGDASRMQEYLRNPGYLGDLKARRDRFGVVLEFVRVESMTVPAYRGSVLFRYVQPGG